MPPPRRHYGSQSANSSRSVSSNVRGTSAVLTRNQSVAIRKYAESPSFEAVRTYSDTAKCGLVLRRRTGVQQLLKDVASGVAFYRAILACDVSRWGRFQHTDEHAHYEFLCKSAGLPVHYCAETFANDGSLPGLIMKTLWRTMAGEYSRDLGLRTYAGQKRLTPLGFKAGVLRVTD
jgi:DNA invertase Pin-like site-specific DNA recombinase